MCATSPQNMKAIGHLVFEIELGEVWGLESLTPPVCAHIDKCDFETIRSHIFDGFSSSEASRAPFELIFDPVAVLTSTTSVENMETIGCLPTDL